MSIASGAVIWNGAPDDPSIPTIRLAEWHRAHTTSTLLPGHDETLGMHGSMLCRPDAPSRCDCKTIRRVLEVPET